MEKYDVVHARLLVQVVLQAGGDPRPVIRNLMRLVSTYTPIPFLPITFISDEWYDVNM